MNRAVACRTRFVEHAHEPQVLAERCRGHDVGKPSHCENQLALTSLLGRLSFKTQADYTRLRKPRGLCLRTSQTPTSVLPQRGYKENALEAVGRTPLVRLNKVMGGREVPCLSRKSSI